VVNLNERLDYFGSTVNIAARLTEFSVGGEVVLSETVYRDDQVQTWLGENKMETEKLNADIKGFDKPVPVWKIRVSGQSGPAPVNSRLPQLS
jgi:class 3 adenylate cyclase